MPDIAKYVILRDPKTNEILIPKTGALEYMPTPDAPDPPYEVYHNADRLEGHPASDFVLVSSSIDASTLQNHPASYFNEKLVSGTNIKTINNQSILGSGDMTINSLPSQSGQNGKFLTTDGSTASWANVAGVVGASVTLTTAGWTQQANGSYAQTVSITGKGLTANSNVIVDCALSMTDLDADIEVLTAWGNINNATLATDSITFYCYAVAPDINIPVSVVIGG